MNDKNKKNIFSRLLSSFTSMFKRLFSSKAKQKDIENILEEEAITSPSKVVWKNFLHDRLARIGMIGFVLILLFCFLGSAIYPMKDPAKTEPVLKNIQPGRKILSVNSDLKKVGIDMIQNGISFSIGLGNDGKLYTWGSDASGALDIPSNIANKKIEKLAVGDKHALVLTKNGEIFGWGYNNFNQTTVPADIKSLAAYEGIEDIYAGEGYSGIITKEKNLYLWGNIKASKLDVLPSDTIGHVVKVDGSSFNMVILLDDGTVRVAGTAGNEISSVPTELTDGSVNVVDVRMTFRTGIALDDQGKIHVWGSTDKGMLNVPEISEKIVQVSTNRNAMYALGESGKVYAWGDNSLNECNVPSDLKAEKLYSGFYQTYAVDASGNVSAWGNKGYLMGTDQFGRDLLARLMAGGKVTLLVGFLACIVEAVIGMIIGMIAGFKGGWVDNVLMRISEIFSSIPFMPLVITLSAFLGVNMGSNQKLILIMLILGFISWPSLARIVRGQILIEREKDFVLAARALGIKEYSIIIRHILPNVLNLCIVNVTLSYASNMLTESGLSFLGFGVQAPMPSWGNMLDGAQQSEVIQMYWWRWILPAICIMIAAFSINLIGDGLRDALDPKANEK